MKLYKSPTNEIYGYELDGSQDHLIPSDFIALTQAEIDDRNAKFAKEKAQAEAFQQNYNATKAQALAKLTALGLTADEVKALIG